jgi:hypothetical protein
MAILIARTAREQVVLQRFDRNELLGGYWK